MHLSVKFHSVCASLMDQGCGTQVSPSFNSPASFFQPVHQPLGIHIELWVICTRKRGPEGHSPVPYRQGEKSSTAWPDTWAAHHRLPFHHWKPCLKQQGSQDTSEFMQNSSLLMRQQESSLPHSPTSCHWDPGSSAASAPELRMRAGCYRVDSEYILFIRDKQWAHR